MRLSILLVAAVFPLTDCNGVPPPASPVSQVQAGETLVACVANDWGKGVDAIIADCGPDVGPVVIDIIADGAILLGKEGTVSKYAAEPRVAASMKRKTTPTTDGG